MGLDKAGEPRNLSIYVVTPASEGAGIRLRLASSAAGQTGSLPVILYALSAKSTTSKAKNILLLATPTPVANYIIYIIQGEGEPGKPRTVGKQ